VISLDAKVPPDGTVAAAEVLILVYGTDRWRASALSPATATNSPAITSSPWPIPEVSHPHPPRVWGGEPPRRLPSFGRERPVASCGCLRP
jgi:hypothetical protein